MSDALPPVLLFTGRPGIGKTTLLKTIVSRLDYDKIAGFYSSEIRIDGHRQGFQIEMATTGEKGLLASPDIPGEVRFGSLLPDGRRRLGISLDFLETIACPAISELAPSAGLVVIDEIGPMQACSYVFRLTVEALFEQRKAVIASIAESEDPWISAFAITPVRPYSKSADRIETYWLRHLQCICLENWTSITGRTLILSSRGVTSQMSHHHESEQAAIAINCELEPAAMLHSLVGEVGPQLLLSLLSDVAAFVPEKIVKAAFAKMWKGGFPEGCTSVVETYESSLNRLREMGALQIENVHPTQEGEPEVNLCLGSETLRLFLQQYTAFVTDREERILGLANLALEVAINNEQYSSRNSQWLYAIARNCFELGYTSVMMPLADILLDKKNNFCLSAPPAELQSFARTAFSAAKKIGDVPRACYFGLFLGESFYLLGRLGEAEATFLECINLGPPPERHLQLLRALGQVSYRRRQYQEALIRYTDACRYVHFTPDEYVATLLHHQAKALFRLARYDEAAKVLQREIELRRNKVEPRAILKAQHELARIAQIQGRIDEAERGYLLVIAGIEAEGFTKFLPAPLYQLMLLRLEQGDIAEAASLQERMFKAAEHADDALWTALSQLAIAMVEFERENSAMAIKSVTNTVRLARTAGLFQVEEDARAWVMRQIFRQTTKPADDKKQLVLNDLVVAAYQGIDQRKAEKAVRYSLQPELIRAIDVEFMSDIGVRTLRWSAGEWSCTCDYYSAHGICSHLVALSLSDFSKWTPLVLQVQERSD